MFDKDCLRKKAVVKRFLKRAQRANKQNYEVCREEYVQECKEYKELLYRKKLDFDLERLAKLKNSIKDPKVFWQTIRSLNAKKAIFHGISSEQWYEHFYEVFNTVDFVSGVEKDTDEVEEEVVDELFSENISKQEVIDSIRNLKVGKSAGPDMIVSQMLKHANETVLDFLVDLFNMLFDTGTFPEEWSRSIIIPIHKKGDVNVPDNYRGIALTSVVSKVYTHILNKRLTKWAEKEEKIIEEQAGFRSSYSTVDHIFSLYGIVQKHLLKNTKLYIAFVDFKKAFDSVNRNALWEVLRKSGVNGKMYKALTAVYTSVKACVRDRCNYSDYFECPRGVKQ